MDKIELHPFHEMGLPGTNTSTCNLASPSTWCRDMLIRVQSDKNAKVNKLNRRGTLIINLQISSRSWRHNKVEELPQVAEGKLLLVPVLVLPLVLPRPLLQAVRSFVVCRPTIFLTNDLYQMDLQQIIS